MIIDSNALENIIRDAIAAMPECPCPADNVAVQAPLPGMESLAVQAQAGANLITDIDGWTLDSFPFALLYQIPATNSASVQGSAREALDKLARALKDVMIVNRGKYQFSDCEIVSFSAIDSRDSGYNVYLQQMQINVSYNKGL